MADTVYAPDPWAALQAQHSDIRREGSQERGEIRYDVASKAADIRYTNAIGQSDIRREQAAGYGDVKYDIATSAAHTRTENATSIGDLKAQLNGVSDLINSDIKETGWRVNEKVAYEGDRASKEASDFFIANQQRAFDTSVEIAKVAATQLAGFADIADRVVTSAEINALKTQLTVKEDGELTRGLINNLKNDELNRMLIERNTDVNHFRHGYWDAVGGVNNTQFAAVTSQLNAFQSQLQETRQGMVNFGTMAGVRQDSTSNNVR